MPQPTAMPPDLRAVNAAASLATTDYIVYMNDDMYVCPDWDLHLWNEIEKIGHNQFFLSSTMIEPLDTGNPCVLVGPQYGDDIASFQENIRKTLSLKIRTNLP